MLHYLLKAHQSQYVSVGKSQNAELLSHSMRQAAIAIILYKTPLRTAYKRIRIHGKIRQYRQVPYVQPPTETEGTTCSNSHPRTACMPSLCTTGL